jgi:hypothetical protein
MVDYYAQSGTPPGRFLGAGLVGLNDGQGTTAGSMVSKEDLFLDVGHVRRPGDRNAPWPGSEPRGPVDAAALGGTDQGDPGQR